MPQVLDAPLARTRSEPSFVEFVALIALVMGLGSLSIDNLLPAFAAIGHDFHVADANEAQLILTAYMAGFAMMQLVWGPLSDAIGRRPVLMLGLVVYTVGTLIAIFAQSFTVLLVARLIQGLGGATARVLSVAIVRDRFEGREMARVMSLTIMVFIIMPVIAPSLGSLFLVFGSWRWIFVSMLGLVIVVGLWFGLRMPETLPAPRRVAVSPESLVANTRQILATRAAMGNATAMGLGMASLMAYLNSSQQIFETEVFRLGHWFPLAFALIAICMGCASFANSRLVRRLGMRRLSQIGLLGFVGMAAALLAVALATGLPPLLVFGPMLAITHFLLSLTMPNFNAMAMEPLGDIAGTGSSFLGFYTTIVGAIGGMVVGQLFNGTVIPLAAGYLVLGLATLLVVLWTERGRLFVPQHPDPPT